MGVWKKAEETDVEYTPSMLLLPNLSKLLFYNLEHMKKF